MTDFPKLYIGIFFIFPYTTFGKSVISVIIEKMTLEFVQFAQKICDFQK